MQIDSLHEQFQRAVAAEIDVTPEGDDRFRVLTPFTFDDGDHLAIVLKRIDDQWLLSDEGNTYMHLSYELDEKSLREGTRQKIISSALSSFDVYDNDGELVRAVRGDEFGNALYSFVQALLKIADVTLLSRE